DGGPPCLGGCDLLGIVGQGGMGAVYRARQKSLNRIVALKALAPALSADRSFVQRFQREARLAARLDHPNLVKVFDVGEDRGRHFILMEYVEGVTVAKLIEQQGRLDERQTLEIAMGVARALGAAAAEGIVHRDVKPSNILLTTGGVVKLMDLGLARRMEDDVGLTRTGAAVGTPSFMSPEQALGRREVDARSDLYSLGATMYAMLGGRPPFQGKAAFEILRKHVDEEPPALESLNPSLSPVTPALVRRFMSKSPLGRPQTPEEALAELEAAKRELERVNAGGGAPPFIPGGKGAGGRTSPRLWVWMVWAVATGTLLGTALAVWQRPRRAAPKPATRMDLEPRAMADAPEAWLRGAKVTVLGSWGREGSGRGEFREPCGVAVTRNGRVLVADRWNRRVQVFDGDGKWLASLQAGGEEGFTPAAVAVDGQDGAWVADETGARALALSGQGAAMTVVGAAGVGPGLLRRASGVGVGPSGVVAVCDGLGDCVQVYRQDGTWLRTVDSAGPDGVRLREPRGVVVDGGGRVYVADAGNGRVAWDSQPHGNRLERVADLGANARPAGLCRDGEGRLYVTDIQNHRILALVDGEVAAA
ncbi:MAG TPA: protein kinase, partial [Candidatus Brocadiia bacterium]|nr:protein kinase [Candidatus Brocadiia bacterium]